jgi:phytoene synthase
MTPQEYCFNKVLHEGSSLYYSLRFLPLAQRDTLTALHAFFNEIKEIECKCHDLAVARIKLQWWQTEIVQLFADTSQHPICQALAEPIRRYHLAEHYFQEMIEGLLLDLDINRYARFEQLEAHCKRTRSVLNLLSAQVLGYQNDSTLKYVEQLGIAEHFFSILRDLRRDILNEHFYIPQEELDYFNVTTQNLLDEPLSDAVQALLIHQVVRIRAYYADAFKYLVKEDTFNQRSSLIRAQLALATLTEIENDGYQVVKHRVHLTPLRKLWITWRTLWQARK